MSLNIKESKDVIVVSKQKQADAETVATLDKAILFDEGSQLTVSDQREHNQGEKTGHVEPTRIDINEKSLSGNLAIKKSQPDALAWGFAFAFDNHSEAATPGGNGYDHTSELVAYPNEPAYFTLAHRKGEIADMQRFIGCAMNGLSLALSRGEYMGLSIDPLGIGLANSQRVTEIISAVDTGSGTVDLVLSYKLLEMAASPDLDHVTIWADTEGAGETAGPSVLLAAVSMVNATKTLTVATTGVAGTWNFYVSYMADSSEANFTWADVSAITTIDEFKMKMKDIKLTMFGQYDGTAKDIVGGQAASCEVDSVNYSFNGNHAVRQCFRTGATPQDYAGGIDTGDYLQTITVERRVKDYLLAIAKDKNLYFSLKLSAVGPEYDAVNSENYQFDLIIPRLGVLEKPMQVNDKKWVEAGNLVVLKDKNNPTFPTCVVKVRNQVSGYLA